MPNKTQIAEWWALAEAATAGPWYAPRLVGHFLRYVEGARGVPVASAVAKQDAAHITASRTAVPAMADMLERAMDALAVAESQSNSCPWCRSWLVWPSGPHTDDCLIGQLLAEYNA